MQQYLLIHNITENLKAFVEAFLLPTDVNIKQIPAFLCFCPDSCEGQAGQKQFLNTHCSVFLFSTTLCLPSYQDKVQAFPPYLRYDKDFLSITNKKQHFLQGRQTVSTTSALYLVKNKMS